MGWRGGLLAAVAVALASGEARAQAETEAERARRAAIAERQAAENDLAQVRAERAAEALRQDAAYVAEGLDSRQRAQRELALRLARAEVEGCGPPPLDQDSLSRSWDLFGDGDVNSADCAREMINLAATPDQLRLAVEARAYFYGARARRQQTFLDLAAAATIGGGIGYAAAHRVGVSTARFWGYSTLLIVMSSEWNAHEPTRVLYDAGFEGLNLLAGRYERLAMLQSRLDELLALTAPLPCSDESWTPNHDSWGQQGTAAVQAQGIADRDQVTAELRRLQGLCWALEAVQGDVSAVAVIGMDDQSWMDAYRRDLSRLDAVLTDRDNQLRFSPAEVLDSLPRVASRAIDTVLTGGEGNRAVLTVQIQETIVGLQSPVSGIDALPTPAPPTEAIAPSPALLSRASSSQNIRGVTPDLMRRAARLEQWRRRLIAAQAVAEEIRAVSAARRLAFSWNAEARAPQVSLEVLAPPPQGPDGS